MNTLSLEDTIEKIKFFVVDNFPFFMSFVHCVEWLENNEAWNQTCCTDGKKIFINKDFFLTTLKNNKERSFVQLHEIWHILYKHSWRRNDRNHYLWNMACDYMINLDLEEYMNNQHGDIKIPELPNGQPAILLDHKYTGWTEFEIYEDLKKNADQQCQKMGFDNLEDAAEKIWKEIQEKGYYVGHIEDAPSVKNKDEGEQVADQQKIDIAIERAVQEQSNNRGTLPGCFEDLLQDSKEAKIRWQDELREAIVPVFTSREYTWANPHKKMIHKEMWIPGPKKETVIEALVVAADSSRSVPDAVLSQFSAEMKAIVTEVGAVEVWVVYWDTRVDEKATRKLEFGEEFSLEGMQASRGGTRVNCVREWMEENDIEPTATILLSDGYFETPDYEDMENVIFAISTDTHIETQHRVIRLETN